MENLIEKINKEASAKIANVLRANDKDSAELIEILREIVVNYVVILFNERQQYEEDCEKSIFITKNYFDVAYKKYRGNLFARIALHELELFLTVDEIDKISVNNILYGDGQN